MLLICRVVAAATEVVVHVIHKTTTTVIERDRPKARRAGLGARIVGGPNIVIYHFIKSYYVVCVCVYVHHMCGLRVCVRRLRFFIMGVGAIRND